MFSAGYVTLFRFRGIPVRAHWSVPLGVLMFSGFRLAPGAWLGLLLIIFVHELGHAFFVSRFGLANLGIDMSGVGGRCRWAGDPTPLQRSAIAWGGVLAQLPLLMIGFPLLLGLGGAGFLGELFYVLSYTNLLLIALNLVPFPPLDGAEAWPFFGHWRRERARRAEWKKKLGDPPKAPDANAPPQTLREALDEADRRGRR